MNLPILYEDADIVAVDKPAGLMTHGTERSTEETAEDWFKSNYPEVTLERAYVHRLDRETSGVLVFAKNEAAYERLRKAFTNRQVEKTYLAIVYGVPKEKRGVINLDIGRSRKDFRLRSAQPKARGKLREALTRYEVIGEDATRTYALLRLTPETGRTHQIRVHLKAIHHPVVGDPLYAPKEGSNTLGLSRLALHAYQLSLPEGVTITSPIPKELQGTLKQFSGDFAF